MLEGPSLLSGSPVTALRHARWASRPPTSFRSRMPMRRSSAASSTRKAVGAAETKRVRRHCGKKSAVDVRAFGRRRKSNPVEGQLATAKAQALAAMKRAEVAEKAMAEARAQAYEDKQRADEVRLAAAEARAAAAESRAREL